LAAEQINAEGGILGRRVEVFGEDTIPSTGPNPIEVNTALIRLITIHEVDFIIGCVDGEAAFTCQDVISEHKKIFIESTASTDELTERVLDDYDKYKYYFRYFWNASSTFVGMTDSLLLLKEITGFNKIGIIAHDITWNNDVIEGLEQFLPENGFDIVYKGIATFDKIDFSSYFASAEAAGVEILFPLIHADHAGLMIVNEYYERQSPMLIYGGVLAGVASLESWENTEGKCDNIVTAAWPVNTGYPLTTKTLPTKEAYFNRWGENAPLAMIFSYDILRFVLVDAIQRAGTIETEAIIEALEETSVETSCARNFVFTSAHSAMMGENLIDPDEDYLLVMLFQWQNGKQLPVYPKKIMDEAGVNFTFPDWPGPWDNIS
jgi:branched-chain amino acid transport system substrate-binding protein